MLEAGAVPPPRQAAPVESKPPDRVAGPEMRLAAGDEQREGRVSGAEKLLAGGQGLRRAPLQDDRLDPADLGGQPRAAPGNRGREGGLGGGRIAFRERRAPAQRLLRERAGELFAGIERELVAPADRRPRRNAGARDGEEKAENEKPGERVAARGAREAGARRRRLTLRFSALDPGLGHAPGGRFSERIEAIACL